MALKTPRLVELGGDYAGRISKKARYERRRARAQRAGYGPEPFDVERLARFMALWSRQIVAGRHPVWHRYTPERFAAEGWRLYGCEEALHPVLICDDYAYAAAPMYDKAATPWAAKVCWFGLIDALAGRCRWLDLGGGSRGTWRDLLERPDRSYKWLYVPPAVRRAPAAAPALYAQVCRCGWRQLVEHAMPCRGCASRR